MNSLADHFLVFAIVINFIVLGTTRLTFAVRAVAVQGMILGILPVMIHPLSWHIGFIVALMICVKGFLIPIMINKAVEKAHIKREIEPFIGYIPTLILGAICTALAFMSTGRLPLAPEHQGLIFVPASMATIMTGFLAITTRRKAISQVVGYLLMENGIFIFGLLLADAMPTILEAAAVLDLLVGIFVMAIVINHISREFLSMDTSRLTQLREK